MLQTCRNGKNSKDSRGFAASGRCRRHFIWKENTSDRNTHPPTVCPWEIPMTARCWDSIPQSAGRSWDNDCEMLFAQGFHFYDYFMFSNLDCGGAGGWYTFRLNWIGQKQDCRGWMAARWCLANDIVCFGYARVRCCDVRVVREDETVMRANEDTVKWKDVPMFVCGRWAVTDDDKGWWWWWMAAAAGVVV